VTTQLQAPHAVLTVTNTGPLVPPCEIERLLQLFQRAGTDRTAHGDGLGLGLSIVQAIAAARHATLTVDPQPQGGLRIQASFPAVAGAAFAATGAPPRQSPAHV
jgi:signal transduction histidine kinase